MVILGLGTNIGDKLENLKSAIAALKKILKNVVCSPVYESQALLPENAPKEWDTVFYNMALSGDSKLSPEELLQHIKKIEVELGRQKRGHWGPREIDIDILAYDQLVIHNDYLNIPHSGLLLRDFALVPLSDIVPNWNYPIKSEYYGLNAKELAKKFDKKLKIVTEL